MTKYHDAVAWIACNDEPTWDKTNIMKIKDQFTVVLIADLFHKFAIDVADDVVRYRENVVYRTERDVIRYKEDSSLQKDRHFR